MSHRVISSNSIRGSFYGGLPYSINWSFNGGESPSTLTVEVINEAGKYSTPNLSLSSPSSVSFGSFNFYGYLTEYNFKNTPNQKTLELKYVDRSIELERYYVGLKYKNGTQNGTNLILVGKQYHPCDTNLDSTVDYQETAPKIDPCDPCPFMPEDKYEASCDTSLENLKIFDVYYTFNELIAAIKRFNPSVNASIYRNFKSQHTGTLKSVLSSWCSDLGLAFYWDPFSNKLMFIDRKFPLTIPRLPQDVNIIDNSYGKSLSNTFSRGFIGTFEKDGEVKDYSCTDSQKVNLKALTLKDLYVKNNSSSLNSDYPQTSDLQEITAAISYLGKDARTAFLWHNVYGLRNSNAVRSFISDPYVAGKNSSAKKIDLMGNMKIKKVYSFAGGSQSDTTNFLAIKGEMHQADLDRIESEDKRRGRGSEDPSYYFILAEVDESLADRQFETDSNIARNFLGKYWYKQFRARVPGATNSNSQVTVDCPEGQGSAQWYPVDEDLKSLSIFGFGHDSKSTIGRLSKDIARYANENKNFIDSARRAGKLIGEAKTLENSTRNLHSFILLERNTKWHIPGGDDGNGENALKGYESLFQWYRDVSPQLFGDVNGRPDWLEKIAPEIKTNTNLKLMICRDLKGTKDELFTVKFTNSRHPDEKDYRKEKIEEVQLSDGSTITRLKGFYGLVDNKCIKITMPGITFFAPVQAFGNNKFLTADDGDSGFQVYAESSADFSKVLPKVQYSYLRNPDSTNVAKLDYHIKQITEDNLDLITKGRCVPRSQDFQKYAQTIAAHSAYTYKGPSAQMSFKIAGAAPLSYNAGDGLSNMSIQIDDNGIFTSYSFEDKIIQTPSDDYVDQYLRDSLQSKKTLASVNQFSKNQKSLI